MEFFYLLLASCLIVEIASCTVVMNCAGVTFLSRCQQIVKADVSSEIKGVARTQRLESQKCIEYMHFRTITFATLETLIFLRLTGCRKTPNFCDNSFKLLVTGICSAKWLLITRLDLSIFCNALTLTSTICNVLTSGLNAIDTDYDILVCVHQDDTRALADYC